MPEHSSFFIEQFQKLAVCRSRLCVGVDPSASQLTQWGLPDDVSGLQSYCDAIVDAAGNQVAVMKPQAAFFERHGPEGMSQLVRTILRAKEQGALVIVDVKRGDISYSAEAYGDAYLGVESAFGADAITLNPYLGVTALKPIIDIAVSRGTAVFVVVQSSNPEARELQDMHLDSELCVAEKVALLVSAFNDELNFGQIGPVGAVVGATVGLGSRTVFPLLKSSLLLVPGIGAQGASVEDTRELFSDCWSRVIPTISRGIANVGPDARALKECVAEYASKLK